MIQHAIATLFGITTLTPIKWGWVAITLANAVMMFWLSMIVVGYWQKAACRYFLLMGMVTIVQGSWLWGEAPEVLLAVCSAVGIWYMLPRDKHGRIFALSIGLVVTCVLMLAVPPPWPHYDPTMYHTRLYSTAAFLGVALGAALVTRNPNTIIAIPWFMAVLGASSQRGFDRWVVGIVTNLMWTACLICWLAISRRDLRATSSTPDAPGAHPRYPVSLS